METLKNDHHRELFSPDGLAEFLGCSQSHAYRLLAAGEIPSIKVGGLRRVRRADVERWLAAHEDTTRKATL